jgi:hypothetical protein
MSDLPAPHAASAAPTATVHSTHYRRHAGRLRAAHWTWLAIVVHGVRLAMKDMRNVLLVLLGLGLIIAAGAIFYTLSMLEELIGTQEAHGIYRFMQVFLRIDLRNIAAISDYRLPIWQSVFMLMIKVQMFYLLIVIGQLGSGLISSDLKTNALPIYFARPVTPWSYLLGKWLTIGIFIAMAMLIPNLAGLAAGILVVGNPGTWWQTLALAADLTAIGVGVMLVGGLLILALSSLTADRRFVIVGWLALALLPHITQQILYEQLGPEATSGLLGSLSLSNDVLILATWLLDLQHAWAATDLPIKAYAAALGPQVQPLYPALVLLGLTALAAGICYRRVVRFSRSAANV